MKITLVLFLAVCSLAATAQNKFALVIGIAGYPNFPAGERLHYADNDAKRFANFIETAQGQTFLPTNVHLITNEAATRAKIYSEFDWLYTHVGSNDTVYVFFAGHGLEYRGESYLMPFDSSVDQPDAYGIPMAEFYRKVTSALSARQVIVFIDACHSAAAGDARGGVVSPDVAAEWGKLNDKQGQVTMAFFSSSATERSWEDSDFGDGLFTYYLLEGLDGKAQRDNNGYINAGSLFQWLLSEVSSRSRQKFHEEQTPMVSARWNADYILAKAAPPDTAAGTDNPTAPAAQEIGECEFPNLRQPTRVDGACMAFLDDVALRLQQNPLARLVLVVGRQTTKEMSDGMSRAVNTMNNLVAQQGIDPNRIDVYLGQTTGKSVRIYYVPPGASFTPH